MLLHTYLPILLFPLSPAAAAASPASGLFGRVKIVNLTGLAVVFFDDAEFMGINHESISLAHWKGGRKPPRRGQRPRWWSSWIMLSEEGGVSLSSAQGG